MDKKALLANRVGLNTADVPIEGVGTIKVRGLSRFELLVAQKKHPDDTLKQERFILATAILDPKLTEDDVAEWQQGSLPMEINEVAAKINELSGIGKDAAKSGVPEVRDEP